METGISEKINQTIHYELSKDNYAIYPNQIGEKRKRG
jgi:hypothetical protein